MNYYTAGTCQFKISVIEYMMPINDISAIYMEKTLQSEICEFQTCFLPALLCIIAKDIYPTMRPFNPDRVNTVKNSIRLSGRTELTPFEKEIQQILIQPRGLHTNKMVTLAGPSDRGQSRGRERNRCKSHIYNANNLAPSQHRGLLSQLPQTNEQHDG